LLRVLESGEFIKVGSSEVQKADVRIVAATNVDMAKAVADGKFREDLYYRLSTVTISVPPLRDRGSDIALLARKFASDFSENNHIPPVTFSPEAINMLEHCRWPGNVRQLKNVVEQVALFEGGTRVEPEALREILGPAASVSSLSASGSHTPGSRTYADEREILFNMIFQMQRRLDSLNDELESMRNHAANSPANSWNNAKATAADHAEELRFLPIIQTPGENYNEVENTHYTEVPSPVAESGVPTLEDTEKETIRRSLERNNGKRKATARELNISERTLYRKIREYGLE
ncbi:MAG: sigma 54-interacting transcriptional regulator, partial [Paramuribaculum sp.]|nr:sigma 54-interacting transcriptional regulator [Paramuribaculum sp.]